MDILELYELEEKEITDTVACIEKLREQFSDLDYAETVLQVVEDLSKQYDSFIQQKREEYNKLDSFFDRQKYYYETLLPLEDGYRTKQEKIKKYLLHPEPRCYETWVTPRVYEFMRQKGYKNTIEFYVGLGEII